MVDWASRVAIDIPQAEWVRGEVGRTLAAALAVGVLSALVAASSAAQARMAEEVNPAAVIAAECGSAFGRGEQGAPTTLTDHATAGFQLIGHTGGASRAVVADAETAWIGEGIGISLLDFSDQGDIERMGHHVIALDADVWSLSRYGRNLYVGGTGGLHSFDISDPSMPVPGARVGSDGTLRALAVHAPPGETSHWVIATDDRIGVRVFEAAGVGDLAHVSDLPGTAGATAPVALDGTVAIAPGDDALVFDISDPATPVLTGRVGTSGRVRGVAAASGWAFIADSEDGLLVVRLGDSLAPVARLEDVGAGRLYLRGPSLFVLEEHGGAKNTVRLIDVADPANPVDVLGGESTYHVLRGAMDLAPVGNSLVAARSHVVTLADLSDRNWPRVMSEEHVTWPLTRLADAGACLYAARGEPGMDVLAVARPGGPVLEAAWRPPGGTAGVHYHDGYLYVSDAAGFGRFDATSPCEPEPRELPFAPHWKPTRWMSTHGSRLVATTPLELYVADLRGTDFPRERVRRAYVELPGWPSGAVARDIVLADEDLAYIAAGSAGTAVVDLADPSAPFVRRIEASPEGLDVQAVDVRGKLLAAGTSDGVLLYDVTDPLSPRLDAVALRGLSAVGLDLGEGWLHVAADLDGLRVLDVTQPRRPIEVAALRVPYSVTSVVASGQRVYAAGAGLLVLERHEEPERTPTATREPDPATPTATPSATPTATPSTEPTPTAKPTATADPQLGGRRRLLPLAIK